MGAVLSLNKSKERSLNYYINAIAAKYILTQNFEDLLALNNEKSCNSLVILTSKIISKYLDNKSIIYLAQYTKQNNIVNRLDKDNVIYLSKEKIILSKEYYGDGSKEYIKSYNDILGDCFKIRDSTEYEKYFLIKYLRSSIDFKL